MDRGRNIRWSGGLDDRAGPRGHRGRRPEGRRRHGRVPRHGDRHGTWNICLASGLSRPRQLHVGDRFRLGDGLHRWPDLDTNCVADARGDIDFASHADACTVFHYDADTTGHAERVSDVRADIDACPLLAAVVGGPGKPGTRLVAIGNPEFDRPVHARTDAGCVRGGRNVPGCRQMLRQCGRWLRWAVARRRPPSSAHRRRHNRGDRHRPCDDTVHVDPSGRDHLGRSEPRPHRTRASAPPRCARSDRSWRLRGCRSFVASWAGPGSSRADDARIEIAGHDRSITAACLRLLFGSRCAPDDRGANPGRRRGRSGSGRSDR